MEGWAAATDDTGHFHCVKEEIFATVFVFEYKCKGFSIDDKDSIEVFFDLIPSGFPLLGIGDLFDLDVGFSDILKATRSTDTLSSLYFISSDHPDFDVGAFEGFNGLFEVLLEFILDSSDS